MEVGRDGLRISIPSSWPTTLRLSRPNSVSVLLGNGNSTFQAAVNYSPLGCECNAIYRQQRKTSAMITKSALSSSGHHDLNQNAWLPERGSNTSAGWSILSIDPVVPNGIVIVKIAHIRQPHLGEQEFRLYWASFFNLSRRRTVCGPSDLLSAAWECPPGVPFPVSVSNAM